MASSGMKGGPVRMGPPLFVEQVNYNEIEVGEVLGKGSYGTVYHGRWRDMNVALKVFIEVTDSAFNVELQQLSRVDHPNIIKLYGASMHSSPIFLVMEFAECGSLYKVLHQSKPEVRYHSGHAINWCLQCAKGVEYLHNMKPKPLIHRDLKSPNLLLVRNGIDLKICDFGTACDKKTNMTNNTGSAAWMAPEVFEGNTYSEKCDVYSWAIILWEVLTRQLPFGEIRGNDLSVLWAIHSGKRPPLIVDCPKVIEDLMVECWNKNSTVRPTMSEIVEKISAIQRFFPEVKGPLEFPDKSESGTTDDTDLADLATFASSSYGSAMQSFRSRSATLFDGDESSVQISDGYFTPPEEVFTLPPMGQLDPNLIRNAPPELLRNFSFNPHVSRGPANCRPDPNQPPYHHQFYHEDYPDYYLQKLSIDDVSNSHKLATGHGSPHVAQINSHLGFPRYPLPGAGASPIASSSESLAHSPQLRHQFMRPSSPNFARTHLNPVGTVYHAPNEGEDRWAAWDRQPLGGADDPNKPKHPRNDPLGYGLLARSPYERRKPPINDFLPRGIPNSVYVPLSPFSQFSHGLSPHGSQILESGLASPGRQKGHRRSSSYGSTSDASPMLAPSMSAHVRHGQSFTNIHMPNLHDMRANYEAYLEDAVSLLHPDLRPVPPQPNCSDSMQIYQNHRQMAAEYIRIQTDLEQLKKTRSELEEQLKSEFLSEDGEKLMRLYEEKEGLLQFHERLETQLWHIRNALAKRDGGGLSAPPIPPQSDDDWIILQHD